MLLLGKNGETLKPCTSAFLYMSFNKNFFNKSESNTTQDIFIYEN